MSEEKDKAVILQDDATQSFLNEMLSRTTKQIREDRGRDILEDLEMEYKRKVEDLIKNITRLSRQQNNAFDFSPNSTTSLVVKNVDGAEIMDADLAVSLEIRNLKIKLELAKARYNFLFGHTYELEKLG